MVTDAEAGPDPTGLSVHLVSAMPLALEPVVPTAVLGVCAQNVVQVEGWVAVEALLEAVTCGWQLVSQLMVTDCWPRDFVPTTLPKVSVYGTV